MTLSVAGGSNVILTSNQAAADQARNASFVFTGILTGNINVLWPLGVSRIFSVTNNTTGAFTLSCGVNSGGSPAGGVVAIDQGTAVTLRSDGTNVFATSMATGIVKIANGGTGQITSTAALNAFLPTQSGQAGNVLTSDGTNANWSAPISTPRIVGEIIDWPVITPPDLWLLCSGDTISRTTYVALFNAIGTTFGAGDGSTTFSIPDYRGRIAAGKDDMGGTPAGRLTVSGSGVNGVILAATGGAENIALSAANNGNHTHALTDPGHSHTFPVSNGGGGSVFTQYIGSGGLQQNNTTAPAVTGISLQSSGSGTPHNNVQPTIIMNKIIYAGA